MGHFCGVRSSIGRASNFFLYSQALRLLHIPTIGGMFFGIFGSADPLAMSLCMEWFNLFPLIEGSDGSYYIFPSIYPAFVGQYLNIAHVCVFMSICESLRHLGHFMAISRWPNQLNCGDPMAC